MRIEANIRVVKSNAGTELFISRDANPYINAVFHLPPDAAVVNGETIEIVQAPEPPQLSEAEAEKRRAELHGTIAPAAG
jgi:hypothetical protein